MNLQNKLKGLPKIYYVNLDNRIDRRDYMESQFHRWKIGNYERVSSSKFLASEIDNWRNVFVNDQYIHENVAVTANAITHLEMIKNWLENTNEPYMIMMEDDYDLSLIEYWHFDWEYLMNNIPYDWDCIQLGYESDTYLNFYLHPKIILGTYFGCCMINRHYAEKIIRLHYDLNGKISLKMKLNHMPYKQSVRHCLSVDYFICGNGRTYCIPLITCDNDLGSYEDNIPIARPHHIKSRKLYYDWWQNDRDKFTLEDFFTYGKSYDHLMRKFVNKNLSINFSIS
jgi:hypothetical protein